MSKQQKPEQEQPQLGKGGGDIESGTGALYPNMTENPRLRWIFIRKVYSILTFQLLVTVGVAATVVFVRPIPAFFLSNTHASWAAYILVLFSPLIVMLPMLYYRERHPVNLLLLALFTLCVSFSVGLACATTGGKAVLEAAILTAAVVVGLTFYTFWAARRGHDFHFLGPFLFAALLVVLLYLMIQMFFPFGKISRTIYGCLTAILFSAFIVYDTDNLIKRHSYDDYICAAISLYLDINNLFLSSVTATGACH